MHFPEGPGADSFSEMTFKGPVHNMLREALAYISNQVIREKIIKYDDRPEADRFYNYPFGALEETLCNAVYHRSYEIREPIEVRVFPGKIEISSFPGIDPSIREKDIQDFRFVSRRYRNRRIGEFLKELDMTEGRGTGFPKILREIEKNGSPAPILHTDDDRTFLTVEFPVHPTFLEEMVSTIGTKLALSRHQVDILRKCFVDSSIGELMVIAERSDRTKFRDQVLNPLLDEKLIEMTIPDKPTSSNQKYRLTERGKKYLKE